MVDAVVAEAVVFLSLDLAKRGDGVFQDVEEREIRRFARHLSPQDPQLFDRTLGKYSQLQGELLEDAMDRSRQIVRAVHGDDHSTLFALFARAVEVVKVDDWIADGETQMVRVLRQAWGLSASSSTRSAS